MNHIGLFEGIGGFSEAVELMGWQTIAWCEWNEFGQIILNDKYPNAKQHGDITKTDFTIYRGQCDILTGGFPCQPYSLAGKRKGKDDYRHLWPEMLRAIREIQPTYIIGENVSGIVNWNGGMVFNEVQADLENEGYETIPFILPACAKNAPHKRERIWFIATYTKGRRLERQGEFTPTKGFEGEKRTVCFNEGIGSNISTHTNGIGQAERCKQLEPNRQGQFGGFGYKHDWTDWPTESPICSRNDGFPKGLDGITVSKWKTESIKAFGNAIVPQVAYEIFKAIAAVDVEIRNVQPNNEVQCGVGENNI